MTARREQAVSEIARQESGLKAIVGIVGFPRCGSSLLLQMLDAGGFPVAGEHPAYEPYAPALDIEWQGYRRYHGQALKLLDVFLQRGLPPDDIPQRFIRLRRDHLDQAKSAIKLAKYAQIWTGDATALAIADSYRDDAGRLDLLTMRAGPMLTLQFTDLLFRPEHAARELATFLDFDLDLTRAVAQVIERPSQCLDEMLGLEIASRGLV